MPDAQYQIMARADDIGDSCHWRAEGHAWSEARWRRRARWVGFGSSLVSALGGAGAIGAAIADNPAGAAVGGAIAILAAAVGAYNTAIQPSKEAEQHRVASAGFAALRTRCRNLARISPGSVEAAREELEAITSRKAQLEYDATAAEPNALRHVTPPEPHQTPDPS
jgi:hypothetical protein